MALHETAAVLAGDTLRGAAELMTHGVPGPVAAAYAAADSWVESVEPVQITWRPGRSLTVRYRVIGHGLLEGDRQVVAIIGDIPEGALVVEGPESAVGIWVVPHDPLLPGLVSALDVPAVERLLASLGATKPVQRVRLRSYRPGRRGVVEVEADGSSIYLKVVPPAEVAALHSKHRHLSAQMPVPDSLGFSRELGIVVMRALPGSSLRAVLKRDSPELPAAAAIAALLDSLPDPPDDAVVPSPMARAARVTQLLFHIVPDERGRLEEIVGEIGSEPEADRVPVHGDFHEAQILMMGTRPTGLIDVDGYGWGHLGDDPATMLGHLDMLAPSCPHPKAVLGFAHHLNRIWDRIVDPVDLRRRTAAVILGLATGPFRVQLANWPEATRHRIDSAVQWLESSRSIGGSGS